MEDIATLISTMGFPICCCLFMWKYINTTMQDFTGKRGATMFDALVSNGEITRATKGRWSNVYYYGSRWFLCRYDGEKRVCDEMPFAYGFSISSMEHDKSTAYPLITTVCFDEFLTRTMYLPDEFVLFMNVLSTIIRHRTNVKIFMLGNTVMLQEMVAQQAPVKISTL